MIRKTFLSTFLAFLIVFQLAAQKSDSLNWTPEFSMQMKRITSTRISPNGKLIAYVLREAITEEMKSEYLSHIWLATSDGSSNIQYTLGEKSCNAPQFSPDSKYLAFLSSRTEKKQVHVMRVNGGEARQITSAESGVRSFQWSPDGKQIAYIMQDPESEEEKEAKKEKRDVIKVDQEFRYNHIHVIEFDFDAKEAEEAKQLTSDELSVNAFDWSPDGKEIVFSHQPNPTINAGFIESDISLVPADSGRIKTLVKRPGVDADPFFSPDGKTIAFTSQGGQPEPVGLSDIYIIPAKGGKIRKLAGTPNRRANLMGWSTDGRFLYAADAFGTSYQAFGIPVKGEVLSVITLDNLPFTSDQPLRTMEKMKGTYSAVSFSSKVDAMAFSYQEPDKPEQVFYSEIIDYNPVQITSINGSIDFPKMGETRLLRWKSPDGLEIEGLLTLPVDFEEGNSYPLILNVHGGPAGVFTQHFTGLPSIYLLQYFADKGYAILRPNPRGSTGYGKEFRYANVKDWGYGDYEDLLSGVDKVIDMGIADKNNLYLMGWSYGGYMTSFMVTRTDRFKAASMGAGLPNLISMTTTTDIPAYLVGHMGGQEYWEAYDLYEKHSAIYHIENVSTPTQVIHGAEDLRVPFTQGQEFYVSLKRMGVPTEMIVLPRTPHGPREPKLQMQVSPLILQWFEKYK